MKATLITSDDLAECKLYRTITGLKPGATYKIEGRINASNGREARMYVDHYGGPYRYVSVQSEGAFPFRYLYVTQGLNSTPMEAGFHAPPTSAPDKWCSFDDLVITEVPTTKPVTYEVDADAPFLLEDVRGQYDGEHLLRLYYANTGSSSLFEVSVNGRRIGNVALGNTGRWTAFSADHVDIYVRLKKGVTALPLRRLAGARHSIKPSSIPHARSVQGNHPDR